MRGNSKVQAIKLEVTQGTKRKLRNPGKTNEQVRNAARKVARERIVNTYVPAELSTIVELQIQQLAAERAAS